MRTDAGWPHIGLQSENFRKSRYLTSVLLTAGNQEVRKTLKVTVKWLALILSIQKLPGSILCLTILVDVSAVFFSLFTRMLLY